MWDITSGDTWYGEMPESELFGRIAKAKDSGVDVTVVETNIILSHTNGNVYVCSKISD